MNGISFARIQQPTNPDAFTPRTAPTMHQTVSTPAPAPGTTLFRRQRRWGRCAYGLVHCRNGSWAESVRVSWLLDSCKRNPVHDNVEMQRERALDSANCRFLR